MMQWLSAASDAASRTGHYFYCMELRFTCPYIIEKLSGISESVCNTDVKRQVR